MPRRISAVLFDLDDTLLDWSGWQGSFEELSRSRLCRLHEYLAARDHTLPDQESFAQDYIAYLVMCWDRAKETWAGVRFADVLTGYLDQLGLETNRIDLDELLLAYDYGPVPGITPFEDAIPVLDQLKGEAYQIGLVTNAMFPMWMRDIELRAYGLLDYFDARLTSGDAGFMKPHPAIYHQVLNMLGVPAERAVFVGDRPANDIAGANEAGLISVLMAPPSLNRALEGIEPHYTINCLRELLPVLQALEGEAYDQTWTE
jgi:putative hydrolase of the HAD superfamily